MTAVIVRLQREPEPWETSVVMSVCSSARRLWDRSSGWLPADRITLVQLTGDITILTLLVQTTLFYTEAPHTQTHTYTHTLVTSACDDAALCRPWHRARWEFICRMTNSCIFSCSDSWDEWSGWGWLADFIAALKVVGLDAASAGLVSGYGGTLKRRMAGGGAGSKYCCCALKVSSIHLYSAGNQSDFGECLSPVEEMGLSDARGHKSSFKKTSPPA